MKTKTIHFIIGAPLTGKTHFIKSNYSEKDKYYVINYADTFHNEFGNYDQFEESERLLKIYNTIAPELHENFHFDDKDLIIEFCSGFEEHDKDLKELITLAKNTRAEVKITQMQKTFEEAQKLKLLATEDEHYYSSYYLNDHRHELLCNFFQDMQLTEHLTDN
ncbi:hypothetical protein [Marivirga lumbricoides]|uniref:hypothetical protein n=1 Tax=Marivirga lumbricoides TaxID=1046115 RepID=UPI00166CB8AE